MSAIKDIVDLICNLVASVRNQKLTAKKKIFELEQENSALIQEISNLKSNKLRDKYTSNETYGFSVSKETGHYFCTSCLLSPEERESPSGLCPSAGELMRYYYTISIPHFASFVKSKSYLFLVSQRKTPY